ncbi:3-oxoacyl-[acyl-carrier-protein] synthase III C-terminal domain-containing protein [Nonomuraea jabiensis]|uniref:3-oxoacyl-[acyl-carrier-protein] synthase III C-terminal domain-containing protein n=1 Tax=Nonomuraea jabiensis TaxID=882448 RepID=UPI0036C9E1FF
MIISRTKEQARVSAMTGRPLAEHGLTWADLAVICVHQASLPSLRTFCDRFDLPVEKVEVTIAEHGNLVARALAAQLAQALEAGRLRRGDLVALVGLASGISTATMVLRW